MSETPPVVVEVRDRKMYIALNRPEVLNAQNDEMRTLLVDAVERMEGDPEVRVGILHGVGGRTFSAGADLKEHRPGSPGRMRPEGGRPVWRHFEAFRWVSKPVIAAIDGHCLGGGLELANYCDIRIATERSSFGQPEPRTVGVTGGPGLIQLSRLVPMGEALLMQLTSQPITAHRADEIGLVQRLCADGDALMAEADALADQMIECDPSALRAIKRVVRWGDGLPHEQAEKLAMIATEAAEHARGGRSDMSRGVRVFRAKDATALVDSPMNAGVDFGGDPAVARAVGRLSAAGGFDTRVLVEQSADEGGMSLTYASFKPGYPLFRHRHETDCLYLVASGSLEMGSQTLWPGDAFHVPAHAPYGYTAGPDGVEVIEFRSDPTPFTTAFASIPTERVAEAEAAAAARAAEWAERPRGPMLAANPTVS